MQITFSARISGGVLQIRRGQEYREHLQTLEGQDVWFTINEESKPRSLNQNAWYWAGIIKTCADHFGYSRNEMHDAFGVMFRTEYRQGLPPRVKSTTEQDTAEFSEYCEAIRRWSAENHNLVIPDPDGYIIE